MGNETITGGGGNNTFIAGTGTEYLHNGGLSGNNTYSYASSDGTVSISDNLGSDTLVLGAGLTLATVNFSVSGYNLVLTDAIAGDSVTLLNEYNGWVIGSLVFGDGTTMSLTGGLPMKFSGNGSFNGTPYNDTLIGGVGNETITGGGGNNTFIAGTGTEYLHNGGLGGNNTYSYAAGDGTVSISDNQGSDTVVLGAGLTLSTTQIVRSGNNLVVTDNIAGDNVTILNQYAGWVIGSLVFGDGTSMNLTGTLPVYGAAGSSVAGSTGNDILIAGAGAETFNGNGGNDTFAAGIGTDTFNGGTGNDTYIVEAGDGSDTINETGGTNTLVFGGGIARDQLWFAQSGQDLDISVIGTNQQVVIQNWFAANSNQVQQIETAGRGGILANTQVTNLVNAMAGLTPPATGQTSLPPDLASQLEPVIAANWH